MLTNLPNISYLKLSRLDAAIATSIATHLHQLQRLTIEGFCDIGDTHLQTLFTHCTALKELDLGPCHNVTDVGVGYLRNLTRFTMRRNDIITDAAGETLGRNNPGLNSVRVEAIGLLSGIFVLNLVRHCPQLKELVVWTGYRKLAGMMNKMSALVVSLLREQYPQLQWVEVYL